MPNARDPNRGVSIDEEYRRLYCELRNKALAEIKTLVRQYVERLSTTSASYDFMNIYGMCSFNPPEVAKPHNGEPPVCKFTCSRGGSSGSDGLVSISGILSPLISARLEHGGLELTLCADTDYHRAIEEFVKLHPRGKMRIPRVSNVKLGSTLGSLEQQFIFTVSEDLHTLGRAYRDIVVTVELLYINILHFLHS